MTAPSDPDAPRVLAPNFKRRLSGVTSTVVRLVPLQAQEIAIAAVGAGFPPELPHIGWWRLITLPRAPRRVWHARRNVEMMAGLALKYLLRKNLALMFTSASQRVHTGYTRALIRRMDLVVATSQKTAGYLERDAHVILHGIDVAKFVPSPDKAALKAALGLAPGPVIGCFGRIRAQKGTDVFVEAMIPVLQARPDATAIIMGRATGKHLAFQQDLQARIAAASLTERLRFLPEVPAYETARWYGALDLFIAPQRWEGFGLTPLEAMASGVPVIATDVGAFPDLVAEGATGHIIAPGAPAPIAEAALGLLNDPDRLQAYAHAARDRAVDHFPIEGEARALIALYRSLLDGGS